MPATRGARTCPAFYPAGRSHVHSKFCFFHPVIARLTLDRHSCSRQLVNLLPVNLIVCMDGVLSQCLFIYIWGGGALKFDSTLF